MPKSQTNRIAAAQRQRKILTSKGEKYGPSAVSLQVIGSGAQGAPKAVYLFTDQKRYLFNCGEGTQRLAHEHKIKLSRLEHIFITNKTWACLGGLPGVSLTLQDVGVPKITLHGPPGLYELYDATRRFIVIKDMEVSMATCTALNDFEDSSMIVKYVPLTPETESCIDENPIAKRMRLSKEESKHKSNPILDEFEHDETDYYGHETRKPLETQNKSSNSPDRNLAKKKQDRNKYVNYGKHSNCSMAYICTLRKRLGTLDIEKCVEKGVKPGPNLGLLKNGQDVVLSDGTVVMSADVKTPDDPGPVFIVLDVPELSYLKEYEFRKHFGDGTNSPENVPTVIIHFTPKHVINQPRYKAFMSKFGTTTQHLVINEQNSCQGLVAVHRMQHKLHLLDHEIFPIIRDYSIPMDWTAEPHSNLESSKKANIGQKLKILEEIKNKVAVAQFQNLLNMEADSKISTDSKDCNIPGDGAANSVVNQLLSARTLTTFHLRPKREIDRSNELKLKIYEYIQETMDVANFPESLEYFQKYVDNEKFKDGSSVSRSYPKVIFLGTGSCIPNKTRNTSAIVVQLKENHNILLDCGEGTYGQLVRYYGNKGVQEFLFNLRAIYVSHLHADHHIGLISVLQGRRRVISEMKDSNDPTPEPPLYLLAPGQIMTWLSVYHQQFEEIRNDYRLIPNSTLINPDESSEMTPAVLSYIGLNNIKTCLVSHCPNAFGVAFTINDVEKITYSGDTVPCDNLVFIGENSSLLIHEATMEDELAGEARYKMHSTTSQAISVGERMKAKFTILTHFSQRYARLPRLNDQILQANKNVGIAFDNMEVTLDDLKFLPYMYAPLQLMFAEHCVEMEMRAAKRELKNSLRSVTPPSPRRISGKRELKRTCYKDRRASNPDQRLANNRLQSKNGIFPPLTECDRKSTSNDKKILVHRVRLSAKTLQSKDQRCRSLLEHCIKNSYKETRASRMRHHVLRTAANVIKPTMGLDLEMNAQQLGHCHTDIKCFKDYEQVLQSSDKNSVNSLSSKKTLTVPFQSKTFSEKSLPVSDKSMPLPEFSNVDYGQPLLLSKNVLVNLQKNPTSKDKRILSPKSNVIIPKAKCYNKIVAENRYEMSKQKLHEEKKENATENENTTENKNPTIDQPIVTDSHRLKYSNTLLTKRRQKYLGKQKFNEDKFNKIEGLNWISWR